MNKGDNIEMNQELLERLSRQSTEPASEISVVTSPGAKVTAWAVKIMSLSSYNFYNVKAVIIDTAGLPPIEIGGQMEAVNLAESFIATGLLAEGTHVLMCRVDNKNVFYAPV